MALRRTNAKKAAGAVGFDGSAFSVLFNSLFYAASDRRTGGKAQKFDEGRFAASDISYLRMKDF